MRRGRLRWVVDGLLLLVALLAAGVIVAWPQPGRVTEDNFDRIQEGMSRAEVEALLGPPGDYKTGPVTDPGVLKPCFFGPTLDWETDTAWVAIAFDRDEAGGVIEKRYVSLTRLKQSPLDSLLWRARRQWEQWFPGR